ncbi:MAG: radical SAM protein [Clostridiales bacterium]|nr:radical SAM protein [Clostridiales bacterium]
MSTCSAKTKPLAHKMTLVMTHQCNFDCKYCLQKHEDVAMPEETALKAIDIFVNGVRADIEAQKKASEENPSVTAQISFYGGEPLLQREKIEKLVGYSSAALQAIPGVNFAYEITTNGTLLDEEFIAFAKKNRIILALSHDGLSQDPVRRDRGGHPTKDTVDGKLQMLLKATPGTIIMMTVHPDYADRVSGSLKFFYDSGVRAVSMVLAHGERVLWDEEKFSVLEKELEKVEEFYEQWNSGDNVFRFIPFDNKIRNYILNKDQDSKSCHFGCHKTMVDTDGRYYPCSHFIGRDGFNYGSVDEGVDEKKLDSLEKKRVEASECAECALRSRCKHTCACANHGHTGNMSEVSALQCEYEQLTIRLADKAAAALLGGENRKFIERMYKE